MLSTICQAFWAATRVGSAVLASILLDQVLEKTFVCNLKFFIFLSLPDSTSAILFKGTRFLTTSATTKHANSGQIHVKCISSSFQTLIPSAYSGDS